MATKSESMSMILEKLGEVGGIKASAVISADGLPIVHRIPQDIDPNNFAAMMASMVGAAEEALKYLGSKNIFDTIFAESKDIRVVAIKAGENAILTVMTDPNANYGLIKMYAKRSADEIAAVLKD